MFGRCIGYGGGAPSLDIAIQRISPKACHRLKASFKKSRLHGKSKGDKIMSNKYKPILCKFVSIVLGVLLGVAMAVLFANGYAEAITAIFPATAVIGLVFSVLLTILAFHQKNLYCLCMYLPLTLFSSLALTVLSVLAMATTVTPEFFSFTVLVFLGASSLFFSVIGLFMLVQCLLRCVFDCDECS